MYQPKIDYDKELEASVLGICIDEPQAFGGCFNLLSAECFYDSENLKVYQALSIMFKEGYPIDLLTVSRYFYDQKVLELNHTPTAAFLCELMQGVFSSAHLDFWCLSLRELAAKRLMIQVTSSGYKGSDIFEGAADIDAKLKEILTVRSTDDWAHISQVGIKQVKEMEGRVAAQIPGISTSIPELDNLNGGFRDGDLIIIGARPGVGKSAFMGRISTQAAFRGKTIGLISLEMENTAIFTRMVAADSETSFYNIDRNDLVEGQMRSKVYNTISSLSTLPIYFSDTAQVNSWDIRAKADKLKRKHGLDMLIIDYLQLVEPESEKGRNREQEVAKISRGMKLLAKSLKIPVILLAQLNRSVMEKGDNKPQLHHLRESGSIEQDADVVMFLHRDWMVGKIQNETGESTEYEADLLVRKWRNGAPTEVKLGFNPQQMRFYVPDGEAFKSMPQYDNPQKGIARKYPISSQQKKEDETPF